MSEFGFLLYFTLIRKLNERTDQKGMLVTALALSVNTVMAAQSIDIKVTGKILPSSCTPAFPSGGGVADFGTMKVASLNSTSMTPLTEMKEIPVAITCEEATRVAVKFTDSRDDSSPTEKVVMGNGFTGSPSTVFGLGMYNDKNWCLCISVIPYSRCKH